MKRKLQFCVWTYALAALLFEASVQNNSTKSPSAKNELQVTNVTSAGDESTPGTPVTDGYDNFTEPTATGTIGNYSGGAEVYVDEDSVNDNINSSTFQPSERPFDNSDVGEDRTTRGNDTNVNGTHVTEPHGNHGDSGTNKASSSAGYVILILILLLVCVLLIVLVYMRRVSRTYSFDLQRPAPVRTDEPIGSFEPVYLDDLDYQIHTVEAAEDPNGTVLPREDTELSGEAENEDSKANGLQTLAPPESSPAEKAKPDQDQEKPAEQRDHDNTPSPVLFIDEEEEEEANENNSPVVRSSSPFVDISLDDHQQASSVQPFSSSIFSTP